jgi:hypothetical protein
MFDHRICLFTHIWNGSINPTVTAYKNKQTPGRLKWGKSCILYRYSWYSFGNLNWLIIGIAANKMKFETLIPGKGFLHLLTPARKGPTAEHKRGNH